MRHAILMLLTIAILPGCSKNHTPPEAFFPPDDYRSPVTRTLDVQAANGAVADRTLYSAHFDGPALNSLGRAKLDALISARAENPTLRVYVDAQPLTAAERQASILSYLKGLGLEQAKVEIGCDPQSFHPVAGDLQRLNKTESGAANAPAAPPSSSEPLSSSPLK